MMSLRRTGMLLSAFGAGYAVYYSLKQVDGFSEGLKRSLSVPLVWGSLGAGALLLGINYARK